MRYTTFSHCTITVIHMSIVGSLSFDFLLGGSAGCGVRNIWLRP